MFDGGYSTYEIRARAVQAVVCEHMALSEVARAYNIDCSTVFRWIKRHEQHGEAGLHRQVGSGRPRKLRDVHSQRFWNLVLQPATKFGFETDLWTVARVHLVVQEKLKVVVSKNTI